MELDLRKFSHRRVSKIASYVTAQKKFYGEQFLQSTTDAFYIQMQYFIKLKTEFDVMCLCYSPTPKALL